MEKHFTTYPDTFGGLQDQDMPSKGPKVVILPIPLEKSTTFKRGTEWGPRAIIDASKNMELYDEETGSEPYKIGILTDRSLMRSNFALIDLDSSIKIIERKILELLKTDKFIISLGGEHSITIGAVRAFKRHFEGDFTVVQLDAHADLRDSYQSMNNSHACVMRRIIEDDHRIVQIGIRSFSAQEAGFMKKRKIKPHLANEKLDAAFIKKLCSEIKTKDIYITFDMDFLDPCCMPAVGTPEPGGYLYRDALYLLKILIKKKNLIGIDFNELLPIKGISHPEFLASKLIYKTVAYKYYS